MVTPTNLWEYYNQKGQSLPSLTERAKLYSDFGLGTGYTGTAQQNTALLGKLLTPSPQDQIAKLQQELVRKQDILTRANQAGITGSMEIPQSILEGTGTSFKLPDTPTTEPNQSGTGAKIASYQTAIDDLQKKLDKMQTDYEAKTKAAETPQTPTSIWQKMMGTTPTPPEWVTNPNWLTEQKTKLWESTGMKSEEYFSQFKSDLAEVTTLKEDYNKAVEAKNQALLREEQRLAPEAVIAGKMSRVEKEANLRLSTMSAQINTKLGIMEMKRGNFTDAQNFVNNAVNDYLTQYKMNVDNFRTFYNVNKDMVDSLKSDYKDIFNKSWDLAKLKLTQEENRTKQIANWIKEVPNANWGSNPLDLTLEDAAQIYQQGSLALAPKTQGNYYWDVQTGTWKLIGEMGGTGLSESLQKDFAEDMSSVSKWGSREAALVGLNNLETALVLKYGRENYQKLLNEVDRLFPAPVEKTKEKSVVLPGTEKTYQVGQATSGLVGSINKQLENLLSPVGETALKVESFFKGLFGR